MSAVVAAAFLGAAGHAATVSYTVFDNTVGLPATNWSLTYSIPQFDNSGGRTLTGVTFNLYGVVFGNIQAESKDAAPATLELALAAGISLITPNVASLDVYAEAYRTFEASVFDGIANYAGTSGITYTGITANNSASVTLSGALVSPYLGLGTVSGSVAADGQSYASGAGNLQASFNTRAGAKVDVVYEYSDVPEASSVVPVLVLGVASLAYGVRRRRSQIA